MECAEAFCQGLGQRVDMSAWSARLMISTVLHFIDHRPFLTFDVVVLFLSHTNSQRVGGLLSSKPVRMVGRLQYRLGSFIKNRIVQLTS